MHIGRDNPGSFIPEGNIAHMDVAVQPYGNQFQARDQPHPHSQSCLSRQHPSGKHHRILILQAILVLEIDNGIALPAIQRNRRREEIIVIGKPGLRIDVIRHQGGRINLVSTGIRMPVRQESQPHLHFGHTPVQHARQRQIRLVLARRIPLRVLDDRILRAFQMAIAVKQLRSIAQAVAQHIIFPAPGFHIQSLSHAAGCQHGFKILERKPVVQIKAESRFLAARIKPVALRELPRGRISDGNHPVFIAENLAQRTVSHFTAVALLELARHHIIVPGIVQERLVALYRIIIGILTFESDDPDFDVLLKLTFDYDFRHYRMSYYNGLIEVSFFDFLKEYASAFFYYSLENPLLFSNYSINVVSLKVNSEYFPLWQYPYFSIDGKTLNYIGHFSHIVNMDSLRLGKKFDYHTGILGFGVVCFCEFNNERGNQKTNIRFKYDDYSPNPINDEMNKYLKLGRHPAVIDYKSYFKLFTDMQRVGDTSLSTVELAEAIIFIKSKIKKNSLFLRVFEPIICGFLSNLRDKFVVKYRMSRNYYSLFYCLVLFFLDPFKRFLERRENMFGYEKILLDVSSGLDEVKEEYSYYLLNKKALANAYATDTHYGFFKRNLNAQSYSIDDIPCYKKLHADFDELKSQNSYLVNDLDNVFKDESDGDNL